MPQNPYGGGFVAVPPDTPETWYPPGYWPGGFPGTILYPDQGGWDWGANPEGPEAWEQAEQAQSGDPTTPFVPAETTGDDGWKPSDMWINLPPAGLPTVWGGGGPKAGSSGTPGDTGAGTASDPTADPDQKSTAETILGIARKVNLGGGGQSGGARVAPAERRSYGYGQQGAVPDWAGRHPEYYRRIMRNTLSGIYGPTAPTTPVSPSRQPSLQPYAGARQLRHGGPVKDEEFIVGEAGPERLRIQGRGQVVPIPNNNLAELDRLKGIIPLPAAQTAAPQGTTVLQPEVLPPVQEGPPPRQQQYLDLQEQRPTPGDPKIWQRILAGAVGAGAGYLNTSGKPGVYVDPAATQAATQGIMYPNYGRRMGDWRGKMDVAKQAAGMEMEQEKLEAYKTTQGAQTARAQAQTAVAQKQLNAPPKPPTPLNLGSQGVYDPATGKIVEGTAAPPRAPTPTAGEKWTSESDAQYKQGKVMGLSDEEAQDFSLRGPKALEDEKPPRPPQARPTDWLKVEQNKNAKLAKAEEVARSDTYYLWRDDTGALIPLEGDAAEQAVKKAEREEQAAVIQADLERAKQRIQREYEGEIRALGGSAAPGRQMKLPAPKTAPAAPVGPGQVPLGSPQTARPAPAAQPEAQPAAVEPSGVPPEVQAALEGQPDDKYTLSDGSVWEIRKGEITPGQ